MAKTGMLTLAAFERELRAKFQWSATLEMRVLRTHSAHVDVSRVPHPIVVDPFQAGLLEAVVHEAIHCARNSMLEPWGQLEEVVVTALEGAMVGYINRDNRRVERWRKLVDKALSRVEVA